MLFIDYVHPTSGKHYPIDFRRYKKAEQCELTKEDFTKLPRLAMELIQQCHDQNISGTFTFDSFYSTVEMLNFIDSSPRGVDPLAVRIYLAWKTE